MTPLYLPAEERIEIIRQYAREYKTRNFIESGTANGDTPAALLNEFDTLTTIELDYQMWEQARARFSSYPHVFCYQGDSAKILPSLVEDCPNPILFWLDGHYCGGARADDVDTPIVTELQAAVKAPEGSVILIDDARLFGGQPEHTEEFKDYPEFAWICELAYTNDFDIVLEDDIIRLTPVAFSV